MPEEKPEPGQECIKHYYYISMQVFNLLVLSRNKEMHGKYSFHGSIVQITLAWVVSHTCSLAELWPKEIRSVQPS